MAYFEPDGTIHLCAVDISGGFEYRFPSRESQTSFFMGKSRVHFDEMSYMLHDGKISLEVDPSVVHGVSMIMWRNPTQEGRWWYARITDWRWVNTAPTCDILYDIDWYQSYQFDHKMGICSIERETMSKDGWTKAEANPWDTSVLELNTAEDITITDMQFLGNDTTSRLTQWPPNDSLNEMYTMMIYSQGWYEDLTEEEKAKFSATLEKLIPVYDDAPATINNMPNIMHYLIFNRHTDIQPLIDLFTLWGITSEISNIPIVPGIFANNLTSGCFDDGITVDVDKVTEHPKLNRADYTYICVESPDGTYKKLDPTMFNSLRIGEGYVIFTGVTCAYATPSMSVSPLGYGYNVNTQRGINMENRVEFSNFPQMPYNIDAYLTYLSNYYNNINASNNMSRQGKYGEFGIGAYVQQSSLQGVTGIVQSAGHAIKDFVLGGNILGDIGESMYSGLQTLQDKAAYDEAMSYRSKSTDDVKSGTVLSYAKPANIADTYVAPASNNLFAYNYGQLPPFTIYVRHISKPYRDQIAQLLKRYGCKSGRIGIPYSARYNNMHFDNYNDADIAYCKTSMCAVMCDNLTAERAIEAMYNNGVTFIDGGKA